MKPLGLLVAGLSLLAANSGFAATDPVSVAVVTPVPTAEGIYGTAYDLEYDLTNNTSKTITGLTVVLKATDGDLVETSGCPTIAAGATCSWAGTLTPDGGTPTAQLTLKYNGIEVPLAEQAMSARETLPYYVAVGSESTIFASADGVEWTTEPVTVSGVDAADIDLFGVAYGNNKWVAVGYKLVSGEKSPLVLTSSNGVNWSEQAVPVGTGLAELRSVTYANNTWVATGRIDSSGRVAAKSQNEPISTNLIVTSGANAESWAVQSTGSQHWSLDRAVYDGTNWYAFGWVEDSHSVDGITVSDGNDVSSWSAVSSPADEDEYLAAYDGTNWMMIDGGSKFYTGTWDGSSFTWPSSSTYLHTVKDIAYGNSTWVAVGRSNHSAPLVLYSTDTGVTWNPVSSVESYTGFQLNAVSYIASAPTGGPKWVAVGTGKLFTSASDIGVWTEVDQPGVALYDVAGRN